MLVFDRLNSKSRVSLKLILPPLRYGCGCNGTPYCPIVRPVWPLKVGLRNSCPDSCQIKACKRISPMHLKIQGSLKGVTLSTLNILLSGATLLVNSNVPDSLGPHHRLRLPNEICQFARFIAT